VVAAVRNAWWAPRRLLLAPGLVALGGIAISSVLSPAPRLAFGGLLVAACSLAAFLLLDRLAAHPFFRPRLRALVVAAAIGLPLVYIVQVVAAWIEWWQLVGALAVPPLRPAWAGLTLGSPNLVAVLLLLLVPPALAEVLTVAASPRRRVLAAGAITVVAILALLLAASRGGIMGLGATVVVGAVLVVARSGRLSRRVIIVGSIGVLAAMAVVVGVLVGRGSQGGESLRIEFWRTALAIFTERSLTGGGPDTWALLKLAEARPFEPTIVVAHAHNLYLWTLAELGIVGTAGVLVLVVTVLVLLLRRAWSADVRTSSVAIGALAAFAGLAVHSLVDVLTNLPAVVLAVALVAARALADEEDPAIVGQRARWFRPAVALAGLGVMVIAVAFVRVDQGMAAAAQARVLLRDGDAAAAQARFAEARAIDPHPLYRNEHALAAAFAGDVVTATALTDEMVAADGLAHHLILQAYLRVAAGDPDGAGASARLALDRGWADPGVALNAARIGELTGDDALATEALVRAATQAPTSLDDPYWRAPERAMAYDDLITEAARSARATGSASEVALILAMGRSPGAASALETLTPDERATVSALAGWRQDPDAAIATLSARLEASPSDWVTAARLAWIEEGIDRLDDAERHARWSVIVQSDSAPAVYTMPRRVGDERSVLQFRLGGLYPATVYEQEGSRLLFGPGSVSLVP
jgi:O-antigen ligase